MPYIVRRGEVHAGSVYKCGEFVPGTKGELADLEASGVVEWLDPPPRESKKPAKRKAVK